MKSLKFATFLILIALTVVCTAAEIAITTTGKKVVLKNDGTWEPYNPKKHLALQDIRQEQEIRFNLKYKDAEFVRQEKTMWWEGNDVKGKAMKDSLKTLPKGGVVLVFIDEKSINPTDVRNYHIEVLNPKGRVLAKSDVSDSNSKESDDIGWSTLAELNLKKIPGSALTVRITDTGIHRNWEFTMNIGG